jgi:hypothetical protein
MKEETFKKVFIHSESVLPKEKGEYVTYIKFHKTIYRAYKYDPKNKVDKEVWKSIVTWYFRPISPAPATKERIIEVLRKYIPGSGTQYHEKYLDNIATELLSLSPERKMTDEMIAFAEWLNVNCGMSFEIKKDKMIDLWEHKGVEYTSEEIYTKYKIES